MTFLSQSWFAGGYLVRTAIKPALILSLTICGLCSSGCGSKPETPPASVETKPAPAKVEPAVQTMTPEVPATPKIDTAKLLHDADEKLAAGDLDAAQGLLQQVEDLKGELSKNETSELNKRLAQLDDKRREQVTERRAKRLAEADTFLVDGKLEQAIQALDDVIEAFPTDEQRVAVENLRKKVEEHRSRRRKLAVSMKLLGSAKPDQVRTAKSNLQEDPEVAVPLLIEAAEGKNHDLAVNALEALRSLNEPSRTLPAFVRILSRTEQSALWPTAVREIQKSNAPGAGEPLLKLVLASKDSQQRMAALSSLAVVVDPPVGTVVALLPLIYADGPELAAALHAARHAVIVLKQFDLLSRRPLDVDLTPEEDQQLAGLGTRLAAIIGPPSAGTALSEAALAAQALASMTRLATPEPITQVNVLRVNAELPDSPSAGLLDGVWNKVEPNSMWRHPSDKPASIVLDLGVERTVAGIRFWNENELNLRARGWKDVDIYVGNTPAERFVAAKGIVPMAPGVADTPDYGCTIAVPSVRGRYIRIECRSYWQPDGVAGLSELQVLGF